MNKVAAILLTANPIHECPDDSAMTKIDGRESALRALELVTNREPIEQVVLAVHTTSAEEVKRKIGNHLMFMGTKLAVSDGGWFSQLKASAAKLSDEITHVVVHDAARPAVPFTDLEALLATDAPAAALALRLQGILARTPAVPGIGSLESIKAALVLTPRMYDRATFRTLCETQSEPASMTLIEASQINVRCGDVPEGMVRAMVQLLPKPKIMQANPFEEAQW